MWKLWKTKYHNKSLLDDFWFKVQDCIQVNLCQKLLFFHQLTHNMRTDCSLNYKFNTCKFQAQTGGWQFVYRKLFDIQNNFCSKHVLQNEELLTKTYKNCIFGNFTRINLVTHMFHVDLPYLIKLSALHILKNIRLYSLCTIHEFIKIAWIIKCINNIMIRGTFDQSVSH